MRRVRCICVRACVRTLDVSLLHLALPFGQPIAKHGRHQLQRVAAIESSQPSHRLQLFLKLFLRMVVTEEKRQQCALSAHGTVHRREGVQH
jgi:hypothetical protein